MRVGLLSFDFGEYCVRLASALSRMADVLLLLPQQLAAPYLAVLDSSVNFQPFDKPRLRQPGRQIRLAVKLLRQLKTFEADVVHLQHGHLWFNGFLPLLRRPLVLTVHDPRHHVGDRVSQKTPQAVMDFGFRRASRLIVHARKVKEVIVDECAIPAEIVDIVPHISLGSAMDPTPWHEHPPTVLFYGRIWEYKGLEYLIRAEPLITTEIPDVRIIIAGEGEDFGRYRRMMVHPDRFVVYNEFVSEERCAELFRQASLVVLPYIEASQSGVIPLAYTWMKPVVATRVGGLPEMVDEGHTGYLVPPRDERALATVIVRLLRDKPLCRQLGLNATRKLEAECAPTVVARQTLDVYHRAVGGGVRMPRLVVAPDEPGE